MSSTFACLLLSGWIGLAAGDGVVEREVRFESEGIALAASVLIPKQPGPHPGLVLVHGSGPSDRSQTWAAGFARGLASRGLAVLFPDKRGCGRSEGDWKTADFETLARDAIAGAELLAAEEKVIDDYVGAIGLSQGGHLVPLAAGLSTQIAFVIDVSGSTASLTDQVVDEVEKMAERAGLTPAQIDEVNEVHRLAIRFGLTGEGWEDYRRALDAALKGPWGGRGVAEGFPQTKDSWVWTWARTVGDYDPLPWWRRLEVPGLIVYGARDTQIRVAESVARLEPLLTADPAKDLTIVIHGDSGHPLHAPGEASIRSDALDAMVTWIREHRGEQ